MDPALDQPESFNETQSLPTEPTIDPQKLQDYLQQLKAEQNLPLGIATALVAASVGAVVWAVVTVSTGYQIGYMAVGVGFLVGYTLQYFGKGIDQLFGIAGAVIALTGCVAGNLLSIAGSIASAESMDFFEVLSFFNFSAMGSLLVETFSPMDVLFYGIAVYEGYRFSFRKISEEAIKAHALA